MTADVATHGMHMLGGSDVTSVTYSESVRLEETLREWRAVATLGALLCTHKQT